MLQFRRFKAAISLAARERCLVDIVSRETVHPPPSRPPQPLPPSLTLLLAGTIETSPTK